MSTDLFGEDHDGSAATEPPRESFDHAQLFTPDPQGRGRDGRIWQQTSLAIEVELATCAVCGKAAPDEFVTRVEHGPRGQHTFVTPKLRHLAQLYQEAT